MWAPVVGFLTSDAAVDRLTGYSDQWWICLVAYNLIKTCVFCCICFLVVFAGQMDDGS